MILHTSVVSYLPYWAVKCRGLMPNQSAVNGAPCVYLCHIADYLGFSIKLVQVSIKCMQFTFFYCTCTRRFAAKILTTIFTLNPIFNRHMISLDISSRTASVSPSLEAASSCFPNSTKELWNIILVSPRTNLGHLQNY